MQHRAQRHNAWLHGAGAVHAPSRWLAFMWATAHELQASLRTACCCTQLPPNAQPHKQLQQVLAGLEAGVRRC